MPCTLIAKLSREKKRKAILGDRPGKKVKALLTVGAKNGQRLTKRYLQRGGKGGRKACAENSNNSFANAGRAWHFTPTLGADSCLYARNVFCMHPPFSLPSLFNFDISENGGRGE